MKCAVEEEPKTCAFEEKTTYLNDYRPCVPDKREKYTWPKERCPSPPINRPRHVYKDTQTLCHWKENAKVPFYLYWAPKGCVNTDPTKIVEIPSKEKEEFDKREASELAKAIKTRPRRYVSPAVSMDDIEDPKIRQILVDFTYITDWEKSCREAALPSTVIDIKPHVSHYLDRKTDLEVKTLPTIPTHLREKSKEWHEKQIRACVDPSEVFWQSQTPQPPIRNLIETLVPKETRDEIKQLVETETIRKEHDRLPPTYAGHRPLMNPGLPLKSNEFPVEHPMVSVAQTNTIRYRKEKRCL